MTANNPNEVVILSAVRTPIGSFCGGLSSLPAHDLGSIVIKEALQRANVPPNEVSEVVFGQVLTSGHGQNPARQASIKAGLPNEVPAILVNMLCGSGLRSVAQGAQSIKAGDASIVVVGGQESMSQAHHSALLRNGIKMGNASFVDTMVSDGLTDAFHNYLMGITAENMAKKWDVSRDEQDAFAAESQKKTAFSQKNNFFQDEIVPVVIKGRKGDTIVAVDEFPRNDTTKELLAKLNPAFIKDGSGTVTAGNASGVNDGAAALVLASSSVAAAKQLKPLARIVSYASVGVDPAIMGIGPVTAVQNALKKAGWTDKDVDLYELNEAFSAQSLVVVRELGLNVQKVNVHGGAIALGHPIGASGARILVTLIHALKKNKLSRGVAALCVGGGMGIAVCIEMI